ncbi:hypothetical protein GCM10025865_10600 [Paraoerskovia sediminicola]|uniref:HTH marR-type domain-containing protein n=1 Tax=Paraoerskovia sediminicola TaxID=1138587 RepID=A0ABM8G1F2_9CELL|nr:MarR family winged helix-turn-helix transcriptional regulator [Paraoerskovia sediminicola]BDZ41761.1 hypothetical protein GCM10025865_10600 [Paraoerskovia sediminicola]
MTSSNSPAPARALPERPATGALPVVAGAASRGAARDALSLDEQGAPLGYLVTKVGRATTSRFTEALADLDIRPKHYGLLAAVAQGPADDQQAIGRALNVVPSAVVAMIDDLEALGAVERHPSAADRRRTEVSITDDGRALLAAATERGRAVDDEILAALDAGERAALHAVLGRVITALDQVPDDGPLTSPPGRHAAPVEPARSRA